MAKGSARLTSLMALAAAASQSQGLVAPEESQLSYRFSQYQQEDFPQNRVSSGSIDAYQIDIHQLKWQQKLAEDWVFNLTVSQESMTGASPLQTFENSSGQSQMIMSGASIKEERTDVAINSDHYFSRGKFSLGYYQSDENDYKAEAFNVAGLLEFNSALTTLGGSFSYSDDELNPTDPQLSLNRQQAEGETKENQQWYLTLSQVLNKYEVIQLSYGQNVYQGYLNDPYRNIDSRPDRRTAEVLNLMYRFYVKPFAGAFHADYRYYSDDWQLDSHTIELGWYQDISRWLRWRFSSRYYRQNQAEFYSLDGTQTSTYQSSDARLSSYGALAFTIGADLLLGNWKLGVDWQSYQSRESWGAEGNNSPEAPGLINYNMSSISLSYRY